MPGFLYADDLVLSGKSEEDLKAMVGRFIEVCKRKGVKGYAGKSKVMLLGGEEGLDYEVCVNRIRLEHVSEFKYMVLFWMNQVQMTRSVVGRRQVGGGLQVLLGLWLMLGICSLSVLGSCMSHCWCLFVHMVMRK